MRCAVCDAEIPAGSKFCTACGAAQGVACARCGHANPPASRFCAECGAPLSAAPAPAPSPRLAPPQTYTPPHLAEKIRSGRAALEGERKQITVLFADVSGFTRIAAALDPEDVQQLLRRAFDLMLEEVHRYEGTVSQFLGDGLLALFGAPIAHEDHAQRAVRAALGIQRALAGYQQELAAQRGIEFRVRIGLNSGPVVVGAVGVDLTMDYLAVGDTVNLASRVQNLAPPGAVVITEHTHRLVAGSFAVRDGGAHAVKGKDEPIRVLEVLRPLRSRSRVDLSAERGLTRFVGRRADVETLRRALGQAAQGRGQVVALVGEPGVGKSRLVWEFTHSRWAKGWLVLESGAVSYGTTTAYLPLIDLVKSYCRIEARDDARTVREKLTDRLLALDERLRPALPAFLALLDVETEDAGWLALDPPQRRQRTLDALKRLLLLAALAQPLLLVFEDLHWIDAGTQALLDGLVESLPAARVLLVVTYRPEYEHRWSGKTYYTQLRIDPLPPERAGELLGALLQDGPSVRRLTPRLVEQTEGNPFFLEECVRTLVETGALVAGGRGRYRLIRDLPDVQVPATVQAVLAARIDRLPPDEKRLLQTAAVLGKDAPFAVLAAVAGQPDGELRAGLARLQAAEFLYEARLFPELEYTFKHALTHEVTYASLLLERRRGLHGQAMAALQALYPDRTAEHVELLAYHAARGAVWDKALGFLRQAGAKAMARSAYRDAVTHGEQALEALGQLPESRATLEQAVDLRCDLINALHVLVERQRMLPHLEEADALAGTLGDPRRVALVASYLTNYLNGQGDHERAVAAGQRALAVATALRDPSLQGMANLYLGQAFNSLGDHVRAKRCLRSSLACLESTVVVPLLGLPHVPSVVTRHHLAWCLAELGEFAEAIRVADEGARIAEAADQPYSRVAAYHGLGGLYVRKGDFARAIPLLERAHELCEQWDLRLFLRTGTGLLSYAYAVVGRVAEALALLQPAEPAAPPALSGSGPVLRVERWYSEVYLLAGRRDVAAEFARRTLEAARERKARGHEGWALRDAAEVAAHGDPADTQRAEDHFRQALVLAEQLEMRPLQARCHLGLGRLFRLVGRADAARTELSTAVELLRAMEMTFWLPGAEAELAKTG